jgi:flavin-dependent dehydrogenase
LYDIIIIGAGPAGSTLARLIGEKYRVLLVDRRDLDLTVSDPGYKKPCGGLLAPDAQAMLSEMGLGLPRQVLVDPQIFVVRTMDIQQNLERYYQRYYINMDRLAFDRWLVSLLPERVERNFGARFKGLIRIEDGFEVDLMVDGQGKKVKSRIIVGADGGSSTVRKAAYLRMPGPDLYISIQERVKSSSPLPYFTAVFDHEISDYYSWVIPKDDHLLIGAALNPRQETTARFRLLKEKLTDNGFRFGETVEREGAAIVRPTAREHLLTGTDGVVLMGEAAGWISPSSAEGISYAFKSAFCLADALTEGMDGFEERYRKKAFGLRMNILMKNLKSPFMYNPILRKMVMASGLKSMKIRKEKF